MQRKKTGKLFNFCCYAPTLIASREKKEIKFMSELGEEIGLLFQISDDLLDLKGSQKKTGKPTKQDQKKRQINSNKINRRGKDFKLCFKIKI